MIFTTHLKVLGVSLAASILVLGACAPLPPDGSASSALPASTPVQVAAACTGADAGSALLALPSGGKGAQAPRTRIDAARQTPRTFRWVVKITLLLSVSK